MRKRLLGVALTAVLCFSLAACGKSNDAGDNKSSINSSSSIVGDIEPGDYAATITNNANIYKGYITLPEYKGVSVAVDKSKLEISDDSVNQSIESLRNKYADTQSITEGTTANGDTIVLDYSGYLDGQAFDGGTATDQTYTIGSGGFITDLDKGLEGLTLGEEHDIPCKFPDDYSNNKDLAGKDVVFKVTVKSIQKSVVADLTDEWVASKAETMGFSGVTTVDGLKEAVKSKLQENAKTSFDSTKYKSIWQTISGGINVTGYPQDELDSLKKTLQDNIQKEFESKGSTYGCDTLDQYLSTVYGFESTDSYNEYANNYAQQYLLEKMAITIIAADNNITVSADDISNTGNEVASYYGYSDYQTMVDKYGKELNAELGYEVLYQKVQEFLNTNAVETEGTTADASNGAADGSDAATDAQTQSNQ